MRCSRGPSNAANKIARIFCFIHASIELRDTWRQQSPEGPRKEFFMDEESKETSAAIASLFNVLQNIKVSSERIKQNQWKSVGKNGEVEFYY